MRVLLALWALLVATAPGLADERGRRGADVDVVVPVVPEEHQRLHFFGRRDHHGVPGTVTINRAPYVCDADGARFDARDVFLFHLRRAHGVDPARASRHLLVREGRVHFVGD